MKKNRMILLVLALATSIAFSGCGETESSKKRKIVSDETPDITSRDESGVSTPKEIITELGAGFQETVVSKLSIDSADIKSLDPSTMPNANAYEGEYFYCANSDEPQIECFVYDDAQQARSYFVDSYNKFNKSFHPENFEGQYQACLEEDHGYIVIDGSNSGTTVFGDRHATSEVYAGLYYADNTVILIMPKNDVTNDRVKEVISLLGLPMADGNNT